MRHKTSRRECYNLKCTMHFTRSAIPLLLDQTLTLGTVLVNKGQCPFKGNAPSTKGKKGTDLYASAYLKRNKWYISMNTSCSSVVSLVAHIEIEYTQTIGSKCYTCKMRTHISNALG